MNVEKYLEDFISKTDIAPTKLIHIKAEYYNDLEPQVYILQDQNRSFKKRVRIASDRKNAVNTEAIVCKLLEESLHGDFFPKVIKKYENIPYIGDLLITDYLEGQSLDKCLVHITADDCKCIITQLYIILTKIHTIKSTIFHDFTTFKSDKWFDYFEHKISKHLFRAIDYGFITKDESFFIFDILKSDANIFSVDKGTLIHFDVKPDNIIWDSYRKKVSLIDYEMSRYSDILFEYTKAHFATQLFGNSTYEERIWKPLVELSFDCDYKKVFINRKAVLYLYYHYLAYFNYQMFHMGKVSQFSYDMLNTYERQLKQG